MGCKSLDSSCHELTFRCQTFSRSKGCQRFLGPCQCFPQAWHGVSTIAHALTALATRSPFVANICHKLALPIAYHKLGCRRLLVPWQLLPRAHPSLPTFTRSNHEAANASRALPMLPCLAWSATNYLCLGSSCHEVTLRGQHLPPACARLPTLPKHLPTFATWGANSCSFLGSS